MLYLLLGRSQSGKSTHILSQIQNRGKVRAQLLLVPEQASYETECKLCAANGNAVSLYAEVFSFSSLAQRVATLSGGLARPVLDEGGRLLVMYSALKAVGASLCLLGLPAQKPEFLTQLLHVVDEMKSCCVSPAQLQEIASMAEGISANKLQDLALIYGAYDAMTAKGAADPRDNLTRLAEALETFPFAAGKDCYIDGFTDFTPQEEQILARLLQQAASVTVALVCDGLPGEADPNGVFASARHTARALLRIAKQNHSPIQMTVPPPRAERRPAALSHLERQLFAQQQRAFEQNCAEEIQLFAARNRREEVTWAAGQIRLLLQTGQLHCRDIAVAARDIEPYRDTITAVFARHKIPIFQSAMQSILQKPVFALLTAALDVLTGNYAYEDVFRYLKSGLTDISAEDCDRLENYVLLWNIRGGIWTSEEGFFRSPAGYGKEAKETDALPLAVLNEIRCKVVSPFIHFSENMQDSAYSKVISLYNFAEEIHLPEQLEARSNALLARGEPELAQEYRQLWELFCRALEQCANILGEQSITLEEFSRLLRLLLSQYDVGAIPASLDRVVVGDLPRLANRRVKCLFLLGADEASLPKPPTQTGLLGEEDYALFSEYGIPLSTGIEAQMQREMTILYVACAQVSERLFVTWPKAGELGGENYPSLLVLRLQTLFPHGLFAPPYERVAQKDHAQLRLLAFSDPILREQLRLDPQEKALIARLEAAASWKRGSLSATSVRALYGESIALSPSRLDRYKSCRFSYFMQYGLQAKPRKAAGFHAPEYGSFMHYVLEFVLREAKARGAIAALSVSDLQELTQIAIERYSREELGGLERQSARFRYLFLRLQRSVNMVVQNVVDELRSSDFQPLFFELGFGYGKELPPVTLEEDGFTLSVSGVVDRVDAWHKDGRLYLKVVDYKTGRKSFDLTDIWNGLGLQLLLYLFALEEQKDFFGAEELVPAGVLYLPARDVLVSGSRTMPDALRLQLVEKDLSRKGLILDDPAVLEALEFPHETGPRFLPIRISAKTGKVSGDALVSAERMGRLKRHIQSILKEICGEFRQGTIQADPFWRGTAQNACLYCDYAAACHFDERLGEDHRRFLPSLRNHAFWAYLEEEGGED